MHYSALLFDLDGTLIDTISLYKQAVMQALKEINIKTTHEEFYEWYTTPIHLTEILARHGLTEKDVPSVRARRDEIYIDLLRTKSQWIPGAQELMKSLPSVPLGLVTTSWMTYVNAIDEHLDIKKNFSAIVTVDDTGNLSKPHPHPLLLAADRLGVNPTECLYIGDQLFDIKAAHAAGMECFAVKGEWSPKDIEKHGAELVVGRPDELIQLLK
jgi:HAD superfamily hydrolase (TIGR01509 family)